MTDEGKRILAEQEGCVLHPYRDSQSWWTIGRGHLIDNRKGGGISLAAADFIFTEDICNAEKLAAAKLDWFAALDPVRRDAIVNLIFNMGLGDETRGLLSFKNTIRAIKEKRWHDAAEGFANSLWSRQVGPVRTERICKAIATGRWDA